MHHTEAQTHITFHAAMCTLAALRALHCGGHGIKHGTHQHHAGMPDLGQGVALHGGNPQLGGPGETWGDPGPASSCSTDSQSMVLSQGLHPSEGWEHACSCGGSRQNCCLLRQL